MADMNEMKKYTAEVIRRASAKKRQRGKRMTRILGASCAALVCAAALIAVLGETRQAPPEALPPAKEYIPVEDQRGKPEGCVYAEVSLNGEKLLVADTSEEAEAVAEALNKAMNAEEASAHTDGNYPETADGSVHILLASANGRTEEYLLCGSMLYRHNTKESRLLTDDVLTELTCVLGIDDLEKGE